MSGQTPASVGTHKHTPAQAEEAPSDTNAHRHLHVVTPRSAYDWRRMLVVSMSLASIGLLIASFSQPWWSLKLYAPQYPHGLQIVISLTGVTGDVAELNELNHYIGMGHLDDAASFERRMAGAGIAIICVLVVGLTLLAGRKLGKLLLLPGLLLPAGFIVDSLYWMAKYGHNLDPHAPLRIPPFTPQLFGNGEIGQFMTFAVPLHGFWMAVAGVAVSAVAVFVRGRVCATCSRAGTCGAVCKTAFVVPPPKSAAGQAGGGA